MIQREQYMAGLATHREYYGQFVTPDLMRLVLDHFGKGALVEAFARDAHFNSIALDRWDSLVPFVGGTQFQKAGDHKSIAGAVCALKEAALQLIEGAAN